MYKLTSIVRFGGGDVLSLSPDLVKDREKALKKIGKDTYKVIGQVCFKAGTVLGIENPRKAILKYLVDPNSKEDLPIDKPEADGEDKYKDLAERLSKELDDLQVINEELVAQNGNLNSQVEELALTVAELNEEVDAQAAIIESINKKKGKK